MSRAIVDTVLQKFGLFQEIGPLFDAESKKLFSKNVQWQQTRDAEKPFESKVDGKSWKLRINDFPEEELFTLLINGKAIMSFSETPENWSFPSLNAMKKNA